MKAIARGHALTFSLVLPMSEKMIEGRYLEKVILETNRLEERDMNSNNLERNLTIDKLEITKRKKL